MPLPRLALSDKLRERLAEDRTPVELHRAVHLVAELVEAGALSPNKWRAGYVFSGWLDELVVVALERRAKTKRTAEHEAARRRDTPSRADGVSRNAMAAALAECSTFASLGARLASSDASPELPAGDARRSAALRRTNDVAAEPRRSTPAAGERPASAPVLVANLAKSKSLRSPDAQPHEPRRRLDADDTAAASRRALTSTRIGIQAVADVLERDVADVLLALGRRSLSAVELVDARRTDAVFVALREGVAPDDIAARWSMTPDDVAPPRPRAGAPPGSARNGPPPPGGGSVPYTGGES